MVTHANVADDRDGLRPGRLAYSANSAGPASERSVITNRIPSTWRALQRDVAQLLSECGFEAETAKKVSTARGQVELDVYAAETVKGRLHSVACECKHWTKRVPQTVIHAFRTVLADIGVNAGYVISMKGFQPGSRRASALTNLRLVTWQEFLSEFEATWYDSYFTREIDKRLDPLMTYAEPFKPTWFDKLSPAQQGRYFDLKRRYDPFAVIMQSFGPYLRMLRPDEPRPSLPLDARLIPPHEFLKTIPEAILKETAYREFLELCTSHGEAAIRKFRALRAEAGCDE
jgi:hypothetical protein